MPDYAKRIADLRRLGAPGSGATEAERKLANAKADELEAKHGKPVTEKSTFTDYTTTSRDGRSWPEWDQFMADMYASTMSSPQTAEMNEKRARESWRILLDLLARQAAWNKPRPPDDDDLIADEYKYDPGPEDDEDYGYDIFEGEEYES